MENSVNEDNFRQYLYRQLEKTSAIQYLALYHVFKNNYSFDKSLKDNILEFIRDNDAKASRIVRRSMIRHFLIFTKNEELYQTILKITSRMKQPSRKKMLKYMEFHQIKTLVESLENPYNIIVRIEYEIGCRISPLLHLLKENIKANEDGTLSLTIREKGDDIRTFILTKETSYILMQFIKEKNEIFKGYNYQHVLYAVKKKAHELFGLDISMHWLRSSRGIHIFNKTKDIRMVKDLLGHKKIETTERYLKEAGVNSEQILKNNQPKW